MTDGGREGVRGGGREGVTCEEGEVTAVEVEFDSLLPLETREVNTSDRKPPSVPAPPPNLLTAQRASQSSLRSRSGSDSSRSLFHSSMEPGLRAGCGQTPPTTTVWRRAVDKVGGGT